jgi:hypothetical protein
MTFTHFPEANTVLKAAPGTEHYVQDLHIYRQLPYVVSCAVLSKDELAHFVTTGRLYLQVDGLAGTSPASYFQCFQRFAMLADFSEAQLAKPMLASFEGANADEFLFVQPLPGQQLPADSHPCAVACFEFTESQVQRISATGEVFVKALGETHAPICVHAQNPISFNVPAEAEPLSNPS